VGPPLQMQWHILEAIFYAAGNKMMEDFKDMFETTLSSKKHSVLSKSELHINPSISSNIKSFSRHSSLKQRCSRDVKSLHQSVNRFQYQINQPTQLFETTLFRRS
jgi:hypothetical protein